VDVVQFLDMEGSQTHDGLAMTVDLPSQEMLARCAALQEELDAVGDGALARFLAGQDEAPLPDKALRELRELCNEHWLVEIHAMRGRGEVWVGGTVLGKRGSGETVTLGGHIGLNPLRKFTLVWRLDHRRLRADHDHEARVDARLSDATWEFLDVYEPTEPPPLVGRNEA